MKTGRTNDEVQGGAGGELVEQSHLGRARPPTSSPRSTRSARPGEWQLGEHTLQLTNLDKVLFPATRPHQALTKRDLIRHHATMAPAMLPYLADRPVNLHRFPDGVDQAGLLAQGACRRTRRTGSRRWRNEDADPGETEQYLVARLAGRAGLGGQLRRHRAAPVDVDGRATRTDRPGR